MKFQLNNKGFNKLIEYMNHRMTNIEKAVEKLTTDMKWVKRLIYYISGLLTVAFVAGLFS